MISDLPPGDKLALKGKIFELQKRLQIIDCQQRHEQEFSYKPRILPFNLPEWRQEGSAGFLGSLDKAEIIKKQKQEMLRAVLERQQQEECTFSPAVNRGRTAKKLSKHLDDRPAHERLSEKGKFYQQNMIDMRRKSKNHDADGNRLFVPAVNIRSRVDSASNEDRRQRDDVALKTAIPGTAIIEQRGGSGSGNVVSADEFLYQDARDRDERLRLKRLEMEAEAEAAASTRKMNSASDTVLRRKAEREARIAFHHLMALCRNGDVVLQSAVADKQHAKKQQQQHQQMGYDDLQHLAAAKNAAGRASSAHDSACEMDAGDIELAWTALDFEQEGSVSVDKFLRFAVPILLHGDSAAAALREIVGPGGDAAITTAQLQALRRIISYCLNSHRVEQEKQKGGSSEEATFKPRVSEMSLKLARRKEKKEKQQILQLLNDRKSQRSQPSSGTLSVAGGSNNNNSSSLLYCDPADEFNSYAGPAVVTDSSLKHTDVMFARALVIRQKNIDRVQHLRQEELSECTFHPKITAKAAVVAMTAKQQQQQLVRSKSGEVAEEATTMIERQSLAQEVTATSSQPPHSPLQKEVDTLCTATTSAAGELAATDVSLMQRPIEIVANIESTSDRETSTPNIDATQQRQKDVDVMTCNNNKRAAPSTIPVFQRLYSSSANGSSRPAASAGVERSGLAGSEMLSSIDSRTQAEMLECTFKPKIYTNPQRLLAAAAESVDREGDSPSSSAVAATTKVVGGFDKTVQRLRFAQQEKELKRINESDEAVRAENERRWARSRGLANQGALPFHFSVDERRAERMKLKQERKNPNLIVDVKLNSTKTAKIQIWHGDDPAVVAESFGLIYSLDAAARQLLVSVIRKSMEDNGVTIGASTDANSPRYGSRSGALKSASSGVKHAHRTGNGAAVASSEVGLNASQRHTIARSHDRIPFAADGVTGAGAERTSMSMSMGIPHHKGGSPSLDRSLSDSGSGSYDSDESSTGNNYEGPDDER